MSSACRLGALGLKTMFVRLPAGPASAASSRAAAISRRRSAPRSRQKARWLGGIALAGWDRLGWSGGLGERWMRMRDRRGPLAALLLLAAYAAALLWSQIWLAEALGAPIYARLDPTLVTLLTVNGWLLAWRVLMRAGFTTYAYGCREGLLSIPRLVVGNVIAILAAARAIRFTRRRRDSAGTRPGIFSRRSYRSEAVAPLPRHCGGRLGRASRRDPRERFRERRFFESSPPKKSPAHHPDPVPPNRTGRRSRPWLGSMIPAGYPYGQMPPYPAAPQTVVLPVHYASAAPKLSVGPSTVSNLLPEPRRQFFVPSGLRRMAAVAVRPPSASRRFARTSPRPLKVCRSDSSTTRSIAFN